MYGVDGAAQLRDEVNPNVYIDRQLNQYGAGAE
jgi:hypothetical protein